MITELLSIATITFGNFEYCESIKTGKYNKKTHNIEICVNETKKQKQKTIIHELGHLFRFEYLTEQERETFELIQSFSNYIDYVSEYSRTSIEEDFSESFTYIYLTEGYQTGRIGNLKIEYIKFLIKKYENK